MILPIPVCQTEGCNNPLFDKPSHRYNKNKKYCAECRDVRAHEQKAFYAWKKRQEEKGKIVQLKERVAILSAENEELKEDNTYLADALNDIRLSLR